MKKLTSYLLSIFCLFTMVTLFACGENYELSLQQNYIEMSIGDDFDISSILSLKNIDYSDVEYSVFDQNVVTLENSTITAVGAGTTFVEVSYENYVDNLEVKVTGNPLTLENVSGLSYDKSSKSIIWNHSLISQNGVVTVASSYTVKITDSLGAMKEQVVYTNSLPFSSVGEYQISVKANDKITDGHVNYYGSQYCEPITVQILSAPKDISFDDESGVLSWTSDDQTASYKVIVNGLVSEVTTTNSLKLSLSQLSDRKQTVYDIVVVSTKQSETDAIMVEGESEHVTFTRLYAPTLSISDGYIVWENTQSGNFHYELTYQSANGTDKTVTVSGGKYELSNIPSGVCSLSLKAASDNASYLSSQTQSTLAGVTKLEAPVLLFDYAQKVVSVTDYEGKDIELTITYGTQSQKVMLENGQYTLGELSAGTHTIVARSLAGEGELELSSDESNSIDVIQLPQVDFESIVQEVRDGKYYVTFETQPQITYTLSYFDGEHEYDLNYDGASYGNADEIFDEAKQYEVYITASRKDSTQTTYYLPSKTTILVIRLEDVALTDTKHSNNSHTISYNALNYATGYNYVVTKDGESYGGGQTNLTSLELNDLEYGHYKVSVRAIGGASGGKLYLDSLNYGECEFDVTLPLETPVITFDRQTLVATIQKVDNATIYNITLNDVTLLASDDGDTLSVDLSTELETSGEYVLKVYAQNEDELILDSSVSSIKIVRHKAPESFGISKDGVITINTDVELSQLSQEKYEILLNDEKTNTIGNLSEYIVKGKLLATDQVIKNTYFLDSNYTQFKVQRLATPNAPVLDETNLTFDGTKEQNFEYVLTLTQGDVKAEIALKTTSLDVLSSQVSDAGIEAGQDFTVTLRYGYVGSVVTVNADTVVYFSSFESAPTTVQKLKSDLEMNVTESDGVVTVSWQESEVSGVTYTLSLNDDVIASQSETSYDITSCVEDEGQYTLLLKISKEGYISSEYIKVFVTRLESVKQITVDDQEDIVVDTQYEVGTELDSIQILSNGEDASNLSAFTGVFDVTVKLIANKTTKGENYYLDSKETTFSFERINTLSTPTIDGDGLMSYASVSEITSYMLKISTERSYEVYQTSLNQIYIDSEDILDITQKLGGYGFTASIKAYVGEFTISVGEKHYLSSYYSEGVDFHKLMEVSNITISASSDDFKQQDISLSWQYDFENISLKGFKIELVSGSDVVTYESLGQNTQFTISEALLSGEYYIRITALGQSNYIDSTPIESEKFTRLDIPTNLVVSQEAVLSFTGTNNASGYMITYSNGGDVVGQVESSSTTVDLHDELYASAFSGNISVTVYALGNAKSTYTSPQSQTLVITKVEDGEITLYPDKLVAGSDVADAQNYDYLITITQNNRIVKQLQLNYGDEYVYEDFTYQDTNQKVDTTVDIDYVVTVSRKLDQTGYILSDTNTFTFTKLKSVQSLGFLKQEAGVNSTIYFRGNAVQNATSYYLTINENVVDSYVLSQDYISLALTSDIYELLGTDFTFEIYAQGLIDQTGAGNNYINSAKTSISGTVLPQVENFQVSNGVLVWDKVASAYDYALNIDADTIYTGYVKNGVHTLTENLKGKSGDFTLNIKSVGNISTSLVSQNVVLDSLYTGDLACTKLAPIQNLAVTNGYISFSKLSDTNIVYDAIISGNHYDLEEKLEDDTQQAYSMFYSEEMYNDFSNDTVYFLTVRATTEAENTLYSDESNQIKVKLLNNNTLGSLKITLKKVNGSYDYTDSYLTWTDTATAQYGYNLQLDDQTRTVSTKEFRLDTEDFPLTAGVHTASISVRGSGDVDSDGVYSLNSKPAEILIFTKLDTPTPSLTDGKLSWAQVNGAGGYLLYLDGKLIVDSPVSSNTYEYKLSDLSKNITYKRYEVQAVPTNGTNYIASTKGLYTSKDGSEKSITKLSPPDVFRVQDGSLTWDINLDTFGGALGAISKIPGFLNGTDTLEQPFTMSMASLQDNLRDKITLRLTASNSTGLNNIYEYVDRAAYYCLIDQGLLDLAGDFGVEITQNFLDMLTFYGWPSLNNNYTDFGSDIPAGLYSLSLNQLGNSDDQLTSEFGDSISVYIPYAPVLELVYTNNSYELRWSKITIPSQYYSGEVKYIVYGIKESINEYDEKVTERVMLTDEAGITENKLNLTELIESGDIDDSFTSFAVYVRGDNNMVLNGKVSNFITVSVLDESVAYVRNGELYWNAQQSASSYIITYVASGTSLSEQLVVYEPYWDASQLSSNVEYYDIYIQATGDRNTTTTNVVLTGPNSHVGKLTKLASPSPVVENGVFYWTNIDNSTSYTVHIENEDKILSLPISLDEANRMKYQSQELGQNIGYGFMAMGDLNVMLDSDTLAYVNSKTSDTIYATLVPQVTNVVATSGELVWDKVVNHNNARINFYRVTLQQVDALGSPLNTEIVIDGDFSSAGTKATYSCESLQAGRYQVTVSGYFTTSDNLGKYIYNSQTAYYLIGLPSEVYTFEKYETVVGEDDSGLVDNIVIHDGILSWTYGGDIEQRNYDYELTFTTQDGVFSEIVTEETYTGPIVDKLITTGTIELKIRVVAREGAEGQGYVNSEYLQFINVNSNNSPYIYQLNGIQDNEILLGTIGESEDLNIIWDSYTPMTGTSDANIDVEYLVTYYTSVDQTPKTIVVDTPYINTTQFNYSISDAYTLYYTIQVLPLGDESYVASYPSKVREIQKPKSVEEVTFNATEMYFTWATDGTSSDHVFRIKDEVLAVDENGDIMYQDGEPIVLRTYLFTTTDNTTNRYYPIEMGAHKVSVAVVVRNATGSDGSLTSDYTYYYDPILEPENKLTGSCVTINLFKVTETSQSSYGGMGTTNNPYLVETAEHFANILYRLDKPDYENSYTLSANQTDTHVTLSEEDKYFHFKQVSDLTGVSPLGLNEQLSFTAVYDGDMHSITWDFDMRDISTSIQNIQYVALFGSIAQGGAVKNLRIYLNLQTEMVVGSTLSLVAYENHGTIENIVLGAENLSSISIETRYTINVYAVASTNDGTISKVINYYDFDIRNLTSSSGTLANFALVGTNRGSVFEVANYADIYIQSTRSASAGIVATNRGNIQNAVFTGDVTLNIARDTQSAVDFTFGGIVGVNTSGTISYAYAMSNITVSRGARATTENVKIAGLVGSSNNGEITSAYVSVNITATTSIGKVGDLALFIANVTNVSSSSERVTRFANVDSQYSAVLGTSATNFIVETYQTVPSGLALNTQDAFFTMNENDFPTLVFESSLKSSWGI